MFSWKRGVYEVGGCCNKDAKKKLLNIFSLVLYGGVQSHRVFEVPHAE